MLQIGSIIDDKYRILSLVGKGGMSAVYLAINEKANKPWAIKEIRKDGKQDFEIVKQSLIVETDLLKKLKHPNLPSIVDIIDQDENFLIVMDYIEGVTLKAILDEDGAQSQEDVVNWALQLCDVLEYLHTRQPAIIYRDMKPANIMLKSDGEVVLIDFGTAREFKEKNVEDTTCLGTQGYAAPEQFGGQGQSDARTDIYCLGATMYHLVTGHNPTEPPYEMYPITQWNDSLSSGLEKIILKCTQKNPADRFQSAQELRDALENYRELDQAYIRRHKTRLAMFFLLCFLWIGCGIGALACQNGAKKERKVEYEYWISIAQRSYAKEEAQEYYLEAIHTDCTREDAYKGLIEVFIEDGVFDDEEVYIIQSLYASVEKYCEQFKKVNPSGYGQFCYDVGNAYWFYYVHAESQKTSAVKWFQDAAGIFEHQNDKIMEYKRCNIYIELGKFYKRIVAAQIEGTDAGMYGEYWNNLIELKNANDEMPDRDLVTLRLYNEIVSRSMEYAKYLKEDGIPKEEILQIYDEIIQHMDEIKKDETSSASVLEEIDKVEQLLDKSDELIFSSYGGDRS